MKIDISNIPSNIKHINALDFKKIKIKSSEFDSNFILDESLKKIIYRMIKTCLLDDGIGLAAPQIGVFKQLFIIKDLNDSNYFNCYFNPKYTPNIEYGKSIEQEGCLSVPKRYNISRWNSINAIYISIDESGKQITNQQTIDGYLARVFQHENDHLQGRNIYDLFMSQNKQ